MKRLITLLGTIGFALAMLCAKKAAGANLPLETAKSIDALYQAGEVNVEGGYKLGTEDFGTYEGALYAGGNYLVTENIGLHGGITAADDFDVTFVQAVEFGLFGRLPWKAVAFEFGTGAEFWLGPDEWSVYADAGLRYRLTRRVDVFGKVRGIRPIAGAEHEHVQVIAGVSLNLFTK